MSKIVTIERHILESQPDSARGDFTNLLYDLALSAKIIAVKTNRAGLTNVLGRAGTGNVHGEAQQKLDVYADDVIFRMNDHTGRLCAMASEEHEHFLEIPEPYQKGSYVLVYDPLDGSSNIDVNVSIGTIFGIYKTVDYQKRGRLEDFLQPGHMLLAAGYVLYGSSTMFVYTTGQGVHGFTLDLEIGEFLLSHENLRFPEVPQYYSANHAYMDRWSQGTCEYVKWLQNNDRFNLSERYIGSLVADFHRNLLRGGVFIYPAEVNRPNGKLRLLYEAAPLSYIAEQAGGYGSNGRGSILNLTPTDLHERTPTFIGNKSLVAKAEEMLAIHD